MSQHSTTEMVNGQLTKVVITKYSNGKKSKRYFSPESRLPFDVVWVN